MSNSKLFQPGTAIVEVPATAVIDISNPAIIKLIEQGGMIGSLILTCLLVWLLTQLIKAAKED